MKTIIKTLPLLFVIFLTSCVKEIKTDEIEIAQKGMDALIVPDGFDYSMYENQSFSISFESSVGRISGNEILQYAIIGTDENNNIYGLKSGFISLAKGLNLSVEKPLHIQQLVLYTKYQGSARFFELGNSVVPISIDDLIIDDSFFEDSNSRTSGIPDCTSFLGNATKISCKSSGISIKSSASFLYVDITFSDGNVSRFEPGDIGKVNKTVSEWYFDEAIDGYFLEQVKSFTVYADCQTSPETVGTELVTFENPCYTVSADSDKDGVDDEYDIDPKDGDVASAVYIPAFDQYSTLAFEDLWPYKGDYDFNDLVVSHKASVFANADNFVTKVEYNFIIRAIGARFNNDLCISFSDPNHDIVVDQITPDNVNLEVITVDDLAEIRFVRFRELFGVDGIVNTDTTNKFYEPVRVSLLLTFSGNVAVEDFKIDEYLRINQEEGRELHKPGFPYTSLIDKSLLGYGNDDTNVAENKYFKSKDDLPWVLEIPIEWDYPKENIEITEGYPNFKDFAQGKSKIPWYTDIEGNKVYKNLYMLK